MRRALLHAFILVVIALPLVTRTMFRRKPPAPPPIQFSPDLPPAVSSPAPAPAATPEPANSDPKPKAAGPIGWLNVRLDLGGAPAAGNYKVVVFPPEGPIDLSEELPGSAIIKVGPVPTGKKAVFVVPQSGSFGAAVAVASVVENGEADVTLRFPQAWVLTGVVVDNTGRPVPKVEVDIDEPLPLALKTSELGAGSMEMGGSGGGGGGRMRPGYRYAAPHYSYWLSMDGVQFSFGSGTGSEGNFVMPFGTAQAAVTLKIRRGRELIKEESVVPSSTPLRLVIPVQAEDPKK